jgi:hypothetical protein
MSFVLAQRRLPFSFCYTEAVKIPEVLWKIKELCLFRIIAQQFVVKTSFRIDKKGGKGEEIHVKPYNR